VLASGLRYHDSEKSALAANSKRSHLSARGHTSGRPLAANLDFRFWSHL